MTSILGLEIDELGAVVSLFGDRDGIVVRPVQVVDLSHDRNEPEEKSCSVNVAGVEDGDVGLAVTNGTHTLQMTRSSEIRKSN